MKSLELFFASPVYFIVPKIRTKCKRFLIIFPCALFGFWLCLLDEFQELGFGEGGDTQGLGAGEL